MKFGTKLTLIVMAIVFTLGGAISYVSYTYNIEYLEEQARDRLVNSAGHIMSNIDHLLFERSADISVIATDPVIISRDSTSKELTKRLIEYRNICKSYASISFFDLNRVVVADTAGLDVGGQDTSHKFWEEVIEGKVSRASSIEVSESLRVPVIYFASPVKDKTGETFGYVVARMPVSKLHYEVKGVEGIYGEKSQLKVDLINSEGLLLYSNYNRKGILKSDFSGTAIIKKVLAGEKTGNGKHIHNIMTMKDTREEEIYAFIFERGYLDFKGNGWILITCVPTKVAFIPAFELRKKMLTSFSFIAVLSILVIISFSFSFARPIRALQKGAEIVGGGNLDYKVGITGRDEIAELSREFDEMTRKLKKNETERKQAEEALRESEERFRRAVVESPFPIMLHAEDGSIIQTSNSWCEITGYTREELATIDDWTERAYGERKTTILADIDALYGLDHRKYEGDYVIHTKSGGTRIWEFSSASLGRLPDGRRLVMSMAMDVTERRQAETEKIKLESQLRQSEKMQAIGQLAGGIAHDFNNQLQGIMGLAEMLHDRLDDPAMREDAANIMRASRRASDLTGKLLAFSRKGKYLEAPVNMHNVIEEVASILTHTIDRRIQIRRVLNANKPMITGDPTQIQNALLNLALNARDALPDGGEITFTTENLDMKDVFNSKEIHGAVKGQCLKICVIDNGIGMDDATMSHIFEPFFTTKEVGKGTGMGLASVYGTVENHSGVINVKSKLGEGTKFSLCFPLFEGGMDSDVANTVHVPAIREARILLVDDEDLLLHLVSRMLHSLGHKVITCKDGMEAVETYTQSWKDTDLIILDMRMPRMNGREAFFRMRAINGDLKVLLISGFSIDGDAQSLLDAGAKGFIHKPFSLDELSNAIREILSGGSHV